MSIVKKAAAAVAIKELYDRLQESRRPKQSAIEKNKGKAVAAAILGGAGYLYKTGKLTPLVNKAKGLMGRPAAQPEPQFQTQPEPAAYPAGPTLETQAPIDTVTPVEVDRPLEPTHNF